MDNKQDQDHFQIRDKDVERRERLGRLAQGQGHYNPAYSAFIRRARLILPVVALIIAAVVFAWGNMGDDSILPSSDPAKVPKSLGKNELLNPRFESTDEKKQPYTITAKRAFQEKSDENLVLLDEPLADILLNSGNWVALEAQKGWFEQDEQKLLLTGEVRLFHDEGYQIETPQLHIDLEKNTAWSDDEVYGQGPAGTLNAQGLRANSTDENLFFTGPAKLVLIRSVSKKDVEILQ